MNDAFVELRQMLESSLASDYAELVWLLVDHRAVIDPLFVLDAISERVETACATPARYEFDADDHAMLMPCWADINALRYAWEGRFSGESVSVNRHNKAPVRMGGRKFGTAWRRWCDPSVCVGYG